MPAIRIEASRPPHFETRMLNALHARASTSLRASSTVRSDSSTMIVSGISAVSRREAVEVVGGSGCSTALIP